MSSSPFDVVYPPHRPRRSQVARSVDAASHSVAVRDDRKAAHGWPTDTPQPHECDKNQNAETMNNDPISLAPLGVVVPWWVSSARVRTKAVDPL